MKPSILGYHYFWKHPTSPFFVLHRCSSSPFFHPWNLRWQKVRCVSDGRGSSTWVLPNDIGKTPRSLVPGTVSVGTTKNQRKKTRVVPCRNYPNCNKQLCFLLFFVDIFHLTHGFCLFCWDVFFLEGVEFVCWGWRFLCECLFMVKIMISIMFFLKTFGEKVTWWS